jgi:L-alanine-DL-glutamate epimerase-like enolase superfamily enzyme
MQIAVDANSGYTRHEALKVAAGLAEQDVILFEDPCPMPPGRLTTALLLQCPVPILVDKQAREFAQVQALVAAGAPAISIKLTRTGYRWAERMRQLCEDEGVLVAVGLNAETGLGSLLSLHFHAAHRHLQQVASESSFFLRLHDDVLADPLQVVGGRIALPSTPGLGGELDERALRRYSEPL